MFNKPKFFDTYVETTAIKMKREYVFYDIPYWVHLKIPYLLDLMHIFKNVSILFMEVDIIIQRDTLGVRRDIIISNTKNKQ